MATTTTHAGVKRPADDSLDDEHRFTKRFNLLNIRKLPPYHAPHPSLTNLITVDNPSKLYIPIANNDNVPPPPRPHTPDGMAIDDTPHRVYVHDLDAEVASIDAEEAALAETKRLVFLPDIERALAAAPARVLREQPALGTRGKELVLYRAPVVDVGNRGGGGGGGMVETAHGYGEGDWDQDEPEERGQQEEQQQQRDEDAMDIE